MVSGLPGPAPLQGGGMVALDRRQVVAGAAAAALGGLAGPSHAQQGAWPTKAVKLIVPVAAGTATDLTARIFGEKLSAKWGQGFIVENRTGADGLIALGAFVSARDEHTLLFSFSTAVSLNPLVHAKLPYDPAVDLVPITTTSEVLFVVAVNAGVKSSTLAELSAEVRANPGKLNWAAAPGLPRFVLERHRRREALDMAYVGYTQTGTAVQDLGEGRIQIMIGSLGTVMPVIESGKARALAIASAARTKLLPQVPSVVEAGFPDIAVPAVGCVYGWKGMPVALRDRLAREIDEVAQDAAVVDRLAQIGQNVRRSTPADLARFLERQRVELAPLAEMMVQAR
jgi:tripartite-type tricarboxylate transporter receptor subunit TctC